MKAVRNNFLQCFETASYATNIKNPLQPSPVIFIGKPLETWSDLWWLQRTGQLNKNWQRVMREWRICMKYEWLVADDASVSLLLSVSLVHMMCLLLSQLTFILDWKSLHRYPAIILFFINICFLIGTVGWLAQFIPGARREIVCRHDGTVRTAEPQIGYAFLLVPYVNVSTGYCCQSSYLWFSCRRIVYCKTLYFRCILI